MGGPGLVETDAPPLFPRYRPIRSLRRPKTFKKIATNFWWPRMQGEIFKYVRRRDLCQRAKPAQTTAVGFHSSTPSSRPFERLFVDFVGPLTRTKRGNIAILVIFDTFSKFVWFRAVRNINAQEV